MLQRSDTLKRDLLAATLILARSSIFSSSTGQKKNRIKHELLNINFVYKTVVQKNDYDQITAEDIWYNSFF